MQRFHFQKDSTDINIIQTGVAETFTNKNATTPRSIEMMDTTEDNDSNISEEDAAADSEEDVVHEDFKKNITNEVRMNGRMHECECEYDLVPSIKSFANELEQNLQRMIELYDV